MGKTTSHANRRNTKRNRMKKVDYVLAHRFLDPQGLAVGLRVVWTDESKTHLVWDEQTRDEIMTYHLLLVHAFGNPKTKKNGK